MIIEEHRELQASAASLVDILEHLDRHYRDWHTDHISFVWLDEAHTGFGFSEKIGRWHIAMRMRIERRDDGLAVTCRPVSRWLRSVMSWMTFEAIPNGDSCVYLHRIKLRFGPFRPVLQRTFIAPLRQHMADEASNLDRLDQGIRVAKLSQSGT